MCSQPERWQKGGIRQAVYLRPGDPDSLDGHPHQPSAPRDGSNGPLLTPDLIPASCSEDPPWEVRGGEDPLKQKPGLAQQSQEWAQYKAPLQVFLMPVPVPISSLCFLVVPSCRKGRPGPGPHPCPKTSQAGCLALAPPSLPLRVNLDLGFIGPREL